MASIATVTINNGSADVDFDPQYKTPDGTLILQNNLHGILNCEPTLSLSYSPPNTKRPTARVKVSLAYPDVYTDPVLLQKSVTSVARGNIDIVIPASFTSGNRALFQGLMENLMGVAAVSNYIDSDPMI